VDGFQVLATIRNNHRTSGIPVLVLTAKHITREEMSTLKQNNIHQLIQKGDVNRIELIRAIRKMILPEMAETAAVPPGVPNDGKATILAVEDNADNMLTLKALLGDRFHLVEAVTGIEGVEFAGKFRPGLILMDIALPEMNGIEALHRIRSNPLTGNIPIVAVTASAMSGDRDAIVAEGFDGYVSKPIDVHELEGILSRFLKKVNPE
jgi:CheY-like chemotaxis protein